MVVSFQSLLLKLISFKVENIFDIYEPIILGNINVNNNIRHTPINIHLFPFLLKGLKFENNKNIIAYNIVILEKCIILESKHIDITIAFCLRVKYKLFL